MHLADYAGDGIDALRRPFRPRRSRRLHTQGLHPWAKICRPFRSKALHSYVHQSLSAPKVKPPVGAKAFYSGCSFSFRWSWPVCSSSGAACGQRWSTFSGFGQRSKVAELRMNESTSAPMLARVVAARTINAMSNDDFEVLPAGEMQKKYGLYAKNRQRSYWIRRKFHPRYIR